MFDTAQPEISLNDTIVPEIRGDLRSIHNIADLLACFGFSTTDQISRRKLVQINCLGREALKANIIDLVRRGCYDESKEQRILMENLEREFNVLQAKNTMQIHTIQKEKFQDGSKQFIQQVRCATASREVRQRNENETKACELEKRHAIEAENLEKRLSSNPVRSMKYSKRSLELQQAERCLANLNQFDDASNVRRMRHKQEKEEIQVYCNEKKCKEDMIRRNLELKQEGDFGRLEEKAVSKLWRTKRNNEVELEKSMKMLNHSRFEMVHANTLEDNAVKRNPEMTTEVPSMIFQHRKHFDESSSTLRGDQLLSKCRSSTNTTDKAVYVESVVKSHDFRKLAEGTMIFE